MEGEEGEVSVDIKGGGIGGVAWGDCWLYSERYRIILKHIYLIIMNVNFKG